MMDTKDEALKMAIETMKIWNGKSVKTNTASFRIDFEGAIQTCKDALEQPLTRDWKETIDERIAKDDEFKRALEQPAQEPIAWMNDIAFSMDKELLGTRSRIVPLYTHPAPIIELKPANIAKARDEIYYAWRKYWAWGIPSKDGEAVFNANGDGFLAGWLACEEWINKDKNI